MKISDTHRKPFYFLPVLLSLMYGCTDNNVKPKKDLSVYNNTCEVYDKSYVLDDMMRRVHPDWNGIGLDNSITLVNTSTSKPGYLVFSNISGDCLYAKIDASNHYEGVIQTNLTPLQMGFNWLVVPPDERFVIHASGTLDEKGNGEMLLNYYISDLPVIKCRSRLKKYNPKTTGYKANGFAPVPCE